MESTALMDNSLIFFAIRTIVQTALHIQVNVTSSTQIPSLSLPTPYNVIALTKRLFFEH